MPAPDSGKAVLSLYACGWMRIALKHDSGFYLQVHPVNFDRAMFRLSPENRHSYGMFSVRDPELLLRRALYLKVRGLLRRRASVVTTFPVK
jgi:hypothetical protein